MPGSQRSQEQAKSSLGCWAGGLLLLCSPILPSPGAGCGTRDSLAPASPAQEFAAAGELPWVVPLQDLHESHLAFGSILSKHWILSTASEFRNRTKAVALLDVPALKGRQGHLLPISTIIPHEAFDEVTLAHNLALLKTAAPLQFSKTVQPICFPCQRFPVATLENCLLAGWLHPHTGSGSLRKLSVVNIDPCPLHRIMTTECCSHREGGNVYGCLGHSGNPVMCQTVDARRWVLKGVLSKGGARCYGPFLYTRVSYYSDWIVTTTAKWGAPASPITGRRRHTGFRMPMEELRELSDPFLEGRALNSSGFSEDSSGLNYMEQSRENSQELLTPPADPRALSVPVYYDYYSGEELPISTGTSRQPWGLRGAISASLLLHLLTCWMTDYATRIPDTA